MADPVHTKDPVRQHELLAHYDDHGHPTGYSMDLINSVCLDNKCKLVEVTMYWDDAGNYSHLTYPEKKPLTKVEHEPFTEEDYLRLDTILKDKASILQKHSLAYLAKEPDKPKGKKGTKKPSSAQDSSDDDVDGESIATPASVKDAVVKDAAWTTWVLWTYANTEIVPILQAETELHCTPAYIQKTLDSGDWQKVEFILNYLLRKKIYTQAYVDATANALAGAGIDQIDLGLTYLKTATQNKNDYYQKTIQTLPEMGNYNAAIIIDEISNEDDLDDEILLLLSKKLSKCSYYTVHLTLQFIENKNLFSDKHELNLSALLDVKDFFIARRAYRFLQEQDLSPKTKHKLAEFAKKYEDRI
ncbi:hypothetical protein PQO03_04895 [Lentisphaera profundi]|uniref:Uncharacterized protein n=1 Tax=Lentisphaera profundi TaxID=1658616 RepID=A0ABY7VZ12_9BACT|nr:hypothetical protein [Lentisphaera profundi]WDE97288.1 hypothetical protein PQO03_04895 [Lentisphaera profundi]